MPAAPPSEEGFVDVADGRVWFRRMGAGDATPLLVLHGGPGAASYYVEPFAERMAAHRPTVVFDQLGCGRSDKPDDPSLWTLDRAVAEVDTVRRALGLERCHLLGQSWGGWLAIEYTCRGTRGVVGLVLASTSASIRQFTDAARELIEALPEPHRSTLQELGARGEYGDPAYLEAVERVLPAPSVPARPVAGVRAPDVGGARRQPGLPDDERADRVRRHRQPARVGPHARPGPDPAAHARHVQPVRRDHARCSQTIAEGIPDARMVVFEESAHCAHEEEPERYVAVVEEFLAGVDRAA